MYIKASNPTQLTVTSSTAKKAQMMTSATKGTNLRQMYRHITETQSVAYTKRRETGIEGPQGSS
jgi:hypothetical protein